MTAFVLDLAKWKTPGKDGGLGLGQGPIKLCNKFGFGCCLGVFAMEMGVPSEELRGYYPNGNMDLPGEYQNAFLAFRGGKTAVTNDLARILADINDNQWDWTIPEKVYMIGEALKSNGHTLVVKNEHLLDQFIPELFGE